MQTLPLVIVNPASARGRTESRWPALAHALATHFGPFNAAFTGKPGEGREIAEREARSGRRFLIACGGDGTISEVANGILDSGVDAVELGILPSGTGGDFRRTLRIPTRAEDAARALRRGKTRTIDVGRVTYVNHEGREESRFFLGVSSCGLSAHVIERVKREKDGWSGALRFSGALSGRLSFAAATLQTTLEAEDTTLRVQLDSKQERRLTVVNFCVANARFFGGGMKIAPDAKINDGWFDIIVIGDLSALDILANGYRLYTGTHLNLEQVHRVLAKRVHLRAAQAKETPVALEVDGELPGYLPATFEIKPNALRVRSPL